MSAKHPTCISCPNQPNYYWDMAIDAFKHNHQHEMYMYLLLYSIAVLGD